MPKRPRAHQLEDESRLAFRAALPAQWVFRDAVPDYGVDGSVEIFTPGGEATGEQFLVQLKATDEPDLKRALTVPFTREKWEYYGSLDLPVLIVRYHAPRHTLYARWHHAFDPYYGKRAKKTLSFTLTAADAWSAATPARLAADVRALRISRSPQLPLPVTFRLSYPDGLLHGQPAAAVAMALRAAAEEVRSVVSLGEDQPIGELRLSPDAVVASVAAATVTLHTERGYPHEHALTKFPNDVWLIAALALDRAGHSEPGARLISKLAPRASVISKVDLAFHLTRCLARARRVSEALDLAERLLEVGESLLPRLLSLVALFQGRSLSVGEREYLRRFYLRLIERALAEGDTATAATTHYNLGNHLRGEDDRLAIHHYRLAARYDARYWNRAYFCGELAGCLFESGRYRLAALLYRQAIALGNPDVWRPLHADALMFSGRYLAAQEAFEDYLTRLHGGDCPEWRLKVGALRAIRDQVGLDEQHRASRKARELAFEATDPVSSERLLDVLRYDALCSPAWFNLAISRAREGDRPGAMIGFLIASLVHRVDVEAWANAFALANEDPSNAHLAIDILQTAYRFNPVRFPEAVVQFVAKQPTGIDVSRALDAFNQLLDALPRRFEPKTFRIIGPEGDVVEFENPPESRPGRPEEER
jgi:tetratricopeptide (TPR) repeat protein